MSILTNRDLEFLASLNTRWRRLYWTELALLLGVDGADLAPDAAQIPSTGRQPNPATPRMCREMPASSLMLIAMTDPLSFGDGPKDQTRNLEFPGSALRAAPE